MTDCTSRVRTSHMHTIKYEHDLLEPLDGILKSLRYVASPSYTQDRSGLTQRHKCGWSTPLSSEKTHEIHSGFQLFNQLRSGGDWP
jgi:hypothetical protein